MGWEDNVQAPFFQFGSLAPPEMLEMEQGSARFKRLPLFWCLRDTYGVGF
jgi:hypothetical protein